MDYRIEYEGSEREKKPESEPGNYRFAMTVGFLMVFLLLVMFFWQDGRDVLTHLLIPGDPTETIQAANIFAENLKDGMSFQQSAVEFCNRVLYSEDPY